MKNHSVYHLIKQQLGEDAPTLMCSKATLVHISHTLEDLVLKRRLPALLFTGFQESSHWRQETERYRELAAVAQQVCIFAGKPLPIDSKANTLQIELDGNDQLRQEWFLTILSTDFAVVLAGEDQDTAVARESDRLFETLWTFDPSVINPILDLMEQVVAHYSPDQLGTLQANRKRFPLPKPNPAITTILVNEMLRFEETLRRSLERSRDTQAALLVKLQNEHERLQQMLEKLPSGLLLLDEQYTIQLANKLGRHYLQTLSQRTIGERLEALGSLSIDTLLAQPQTAVPLSIERHGRLHRYYEIIAQRNQHADTHEWLIVIRDQTHEKQMEAHLRNQEKLAALGQMAAGLAHDFNNLLTGIVTSAELISLSAQDAKNVKRAEAIVKQGMNAAMEVSQLLDFSRKSILMQRPFSLKEQLTRQLTTLRRQLPATIALKTDLADDPLFITADSDALQKTWRNLSQNAHEAMPFGGTLTFRLEAQTYDKNNLPLPDMQPGRWAKISVSDTGLGIQADVLPQIFTPFFTTKGVGEGSGLGLSQVYGIVRQHGGQITADSTPNKGTQFTIYLPANEPTSAAGL